MQIENPLDQYKMLTVIGKGSYAKVVLIQKKSTGMLYALKSMKKKYIQKKKQEQRILTQKEILAEIKHPFLVDMKASFQDEKKLYIVLEYCPGGELFGLLLKKKRLSEEQARFYIAQVILAIEYLHEKGIIYRDLKPQNILIDRDGYIKLTDFGLSKNKMSEDNDAFSICGTPQYLAPEILKKSGHGKAVDWWCLGSILYELSHGLPPFYSQSRPDLFNKIKNSEPFIPSYWSDNLKDLLSQLLEKDPYIRIKKAAKIKNHLWFANLNWNDLISKKITPPFVPKINHQFDVTNFDREFTECEVMSLAESSPAGNNLLGFSFERSLQSENPIEEDQKDQEQGEGRFVMEVQQ